MANFEIKDPPEYTEEIRKFETTDKAHADLFNAVVSALVNNDSFLKKIVDDYETRHKVDNVIHITNEERKKWNGKAESDDLEEKLTAKEAVDLIYPIGSIYMSASDVNPATLFKETEWENYGQGKTLIGKAAEGTFGKLGATGGATSKNIQVNAHTHDISHTHTIASHSHTIAHTHTVNAHSHSIAHTHGIAAHSHTIGQATLATSQLGSHYHGIITPASRGKLGVTTAGDGGTKYSGYTAIDYWDKGEVTIASNGGNGSHNHTCSGTGLNTGGSSASNSGNSSPATGGASAANSGGSGTLTSGSASTANSGSAGAQTIAVDVTQPYIVVNMWKRIA